MKRLLILAATTGYQLRSFDEAAERLGVELVFATDRCHALDDPWQDSAVAVRFHEEAASVRAIVRAARHRPVHGVVAVGDRPAVLTALASDALGLPGNPPDAARASTNKLLARARFAAAGLTVPWFDIVPADANAKTAATDGRVRFPCVLKPLGLSGSRGVIRADDPAGFVRAFERIRRLLGRKDVRALRSGAEAEILIEGFIEGREYAVEGVLTDGNLEAFAIFDKPDPLDGPFFEETIYVTPPPLPEQLQQAIVDEVQRGTRALGLRHGPVHAECRVGRGRVVLLEIAARPIGGLCSKVLRFSGGASLEELLLRHALGESVSGMRREDGGAAVMMVPIPRRGILKRVHGEEDARAVGGVYEVRITAKPDQLLEPLPEAGSYLGFIFARASRAADAEAAVREAHRRLTFDIDPAIDVNTSEPAATPR